MRNGAHHVVVEIVCKVCGNCQELKIARPIESYSALHHDTAMSNVQAKIDILAAKLQKSQALDKELSATGSSKVFAGCISALIILAACIAALLAAGGFPVALLDLAGFDGITTGNIMGLVGVGGRIDQTTRDILEVIEEMQRDESGVEALEVARQLVASSSDAQKTVEAIRNEIALMAQELEDRDQQLETGDKNSCNLEVWEHCCVNTALFVDLNTHVFH